MNRINNTWIPSVAALAAAFIPCLACAGGDAVVPESPVPVVTLRVGHNNWIGYIGYYAAKEAGYFEQAGLKIEEKTFASPGDGLIPLANGDIDISLTTIDSVILYLGRSPDSMKVVYMNDTSAGADAIVAAADLRSPADLKGRKVGVTLGGCGEILLIKALESVGLTEKDVSLINMDPDAAGAAVKAGSVDAAVTWEPWISQLIGSEHANVIFSSKQAPNIILDCTAVRTGLSEAQKENVHRFVEVMNRGNELAMSDPAAAAKWVSGKLELPEADIVEMLGTVKLYNAVENKELLEGAALPAAHDVLDLFESKGVLEPDLSLDGMFDASFLP